MPEKAKNRVQPFLSISEKAKIGKALGLAAGVAAGNLQPIDKLAGLEAGVLAGLGGVLKDAKHIQGEFGSEGYWYNLGNHGKIVYSRYRGRDRTLPDGTEIKRGDTFGVINLIKNVDNFIGTDSVTASRVLFQDFLQGMISLADDIESHKFPDEVTIIGGISHLASIKLMEKLGFNVEEPDVISKLFAAMYGVQRSRKMGSPDSYGNLLKKKWRRTHQVWISTQQIVKSKPLFSRLLLEQGFGAG